MDALFPRIFVFSIDVLKTSRLQLFKSLFSYIMEFLSVCRFFVSVSEEVYNILTNSPLDLCKGIAPIVIGWGMYHVAPESKSMPHAICQSEDEIDVVKGLG